MRGKKNNLIGQKFARLIVIKKSENRYWNGLVWICVCDCGKLLEVAGCHLKRGNVKSCGCLRKKPGNLNQNFRHGDTWANGRKRLHSIWHGIKNRCLNFQQPSFKYYGARGIRICKEWKENYLVFKSWAISSGYKEGLTIDRINSRGNYEPSNCHWITKSENSKKSCREHREKIDINQPKDKANNDVLS